MTSLTQTRGRKIGKISQERLSKVSHTDHVYVRVGLVSLSRGKPRGLCRASEIVKNKQKLYKVGL